MNVCIYNYIFCLSVIFLSLSLFLYLSIYLSIYLFETPSVCTVMSIAAVSSVWWMYLKLKSKINQLFNGMWKWDSLTWGFLKWGGPKVIQVSLNLRDGAGDWLCTREYCCGVLGPPVSPGFEQHQHGWCVWHILSCSRELLWSKMWNFSISNHTVARFEDFVASHPLNRQIDSPPMPSDAGISRPGEGEPVGPNQSSKSLAPLLHWVMGCPRH